jgi:hypothetical protein
MVITITGVTKEAEIGILLHQFPQVEDKTGHHLVTNLALEVGEVQVVGLIPVSVETTDESVNLDPVEHLKAKTEMV